MIQYFTFGQNHRHPITKEAMKDYWIEIEANDEVIARAIMFNKYGIKWSHQYDAKDFEPSYFPNGCYERLTQDEE